MATRELNNKEFIIKNSGLETARITSQGGFHSDAETLNIVDNAITATGKNDILINNAGTIDIINFPAGIGQYTVTIGVNTGVTGDVVITNAGNILFASGGNSITLTRGVYHTFRKIGTGAELVTHEPSANIVTYEEGTFTPFLYGKTTAGTPIYTVQSGVYQRVGNEVSATLRLVWATLDSVGEMRIGGLPFTCRAGTDNRGAVLFIYKHSLNMGTDVLAGMVEQNQTYIRLQEGAPSSSSVAVVNTQLSVAGEIHVNCKYFI